MAEDPLADFKGKTTEYSAFLYGILLHSVALVILIVLNAGVEWAINYFQPHGIENVIFRAVQAVFGAATIGPVVIFVVLDLWIQYIKATKKIEAEKKKD